MLFRFSKMYCLGDDLLLAEQIGQHVHVGAADVQRLAHRSRGIGFKRMVLVELPRRPEVDFHCRVFAANGSEVDCSFIELCCALRFLRERKITALRRLCFSSRNGNFHALYAADGRVSVEYPLQDFNESEFARSWPVDLTGGFSAGRGGELQVHQLQQPADGSLSLELVKGELSLCLFFARQSVELSGRASRIFEGQVKL